MELNLIETRKFIDNDVEETERLAARTLYSIFFNELGRYAAIYTVGAKTTSDQPRHRPRALRPRRSPREGGQVI